ncbi:MAG: Na+/H+ antiporter [Azospira oryzae]|jgi:Na+/H+ antiporter|nr:MAG: Na+/H+ antiporter [Azospira oryzae]
MENISIIIALLAVVTALAQITDKIRIPYPILLVLAGMGIGFTPWLPNISLDPDIVFLLFLPPVLYAAAWNTSWYEFKAARRPISLLAIGCVLFTTTAVAAIAHHFIPGFGWAESFVLGAIVSPPDAVAATAATKGLALPKRLITILEGESLVNDATGLIAYRYAITTVATGTFIFWLASINFFYVAGVGLLVGVAAGYTFYWIHRITPDNAVTDTTFTLLAPYVSYLAAEHIHSSGVLAVVTCGIIMSWTSSEVFNHKTRLQANAVWETMTFLLNGIIFILIGLQLPTILNNIHGESLSSLMLYGALVSAATIIVRIIWVFPGTYLPRWIFKAIRKKEEMPDVKQVAIVAWSGMRGVVSLAAALALPLTVRGTEFPNRDMIIFLTFCVIFSTLVIQGFTLRPIVKWLNIQADGNQHEREARFRIASSAIEHIEENYSLSLSDQVLSKVKSKYELRIQRMQQKENEEGKLSEEKIREFLNVQQELLSHERRMSIDMRNKGQIDDEVLHRIEYELDLEETRLRLELLEV